MASSCKRGRGGRVSFLYRFLPLPHRGCTHLLSAVPTLLPSHTLQPQLPPLSHSPPPRWDAATKTYLATPLGRATTASQLPPEDALQVGVGG